LDPIGWAGVVTLLLVSAPATADAQAERDPTLLTIARLPQRT
jgi:hypothetical protein